MRAGLDWALSGARDARPMNVKLTQPELIDEVTRYLATVELFRSLGCEPVWRGESTRLPEPDEPLLGTGATAPSAH